MEIRGLEEKKRRGVGEQLRSGEKRRRGVGRREAIEKN